MSEENQPATNRPKRVLLSSFEPFNGALRNPSQDTVNEVMRRAGLEQLIAQAEHGDLQLTSVVLPVEYTQAGNELLQAAQAHQPDVVISVGLIEHKRRMRIERVGVNLRDARIPDNADAQPQDEPVIAGGPDALFSTLRVRAAYERIITAGLPVKISMTAGTFVCNDVLYTALHHFQTAEPRVRAGFMHVPDVHAHDAGVSVEESANALDLLLTESLVEDN